MTLLGRRPTGALAFAVWLLALGPASLSEAQRSASAPERSDASAVTPSTAGAGVEIRVVPALGAEADARVAPRAPIERCIAGGARRLSTLGGTARFQIRWDRGSLVVVLLESTLGDHHTEACLRRGIGSARHLLRRQISGQDLIAVEVTAPTQVRFCHPDGSEVSSGRSIPDCALGEAARASADGLREALGRARVRPGQTLEQSCGFTHVVVWLDAGGHLVAYGASSVNSDGESPAVDEYVQERAAALRVLAARVRPHRHDTGVLHHLVFMLGGCD